MQETRRKGVQDSLRLRALDIAHVQPRQRLQGMRESTRARITQAILAAGVVVGRESDCGRMGCFGCE